MNFTNDPTGLSSVSTGTYLGVLDRTCIATNTNPINAIIAPTAIPTIAPIDSLSSSGGVVVIERVVVVGEGVVVVVVVGEGVVVVVVERVVVVVVVVGEGVVVVVGERVVVVVVVVGEGVVVVVVERVVVVVEDNSDTYIQCSPSISRMLMRLVRPG